jgi:hypothetical protein
MWQTYAERANVIPWPDSKKEVVKKASGKKASGKKGKAKK